MKFRTVLIYALCCLAAGSASADNSAVLNQNPEDDVISILGQACEKLKAGEEKSTIRVRVTDKASFLAVSQVKDVNSLRSEMSEHDFNVLVYNLVDDAIEDMSVNTLRQNADELCVEVKGYLRLASIFTAITHQAEAEQDERGNLKETMTDIVSDVNRSYSDLPKGKADVIPATDDAELAKYIAPGSDDYQPLSNTPGAEVRPQPAGQNAPRVSVEMTDAVKHQVVTTTSENKAPVVLDDKRGLVYIEPTEFFDNSRSAIHAKTIKDMFAADEGFYLTDNKDLADYVIKTKVLRAKVDAINSSTNRLQMVVAVEAEFPEDKSSISEHRNRFVLFSTEESEQEVAFRLMKKLFTSAGEQIKRKVDQAERHRRPDKALPNIITPTASRQPV